MMNKVGIIAIGRNEGERLEACLRSLPARAQTVYVDSGSTDGSVALARSLGFTVVELDMSVPFTAARARNAGLAALGKLFPQPTYVQMIDGDCIMDPTWLSNGKQALRNDDDLAAVFGRLRERFPERSLYNRMCDREWDVPLGYAMACGGIALFRFDRLTEAGAYDPTLIAGEEPELCARLRQRGWKIRRIASEMALHDAAMSRFSEYWRRSKRHGHACSELVSRNQKSADPNWAQQVRSIIIWSVIIPLAILTAAIIGSAYTPMSWLMSMALCGLYPVQIIRIARREHAEGATIRFATARAGLLMVGKFAELTGLLAFHSRRLSRRPAALIEHKIAVR